MTIFIFFYFFFSRFQAALNATNSITTSRQPTHVAYATGTQIIHWSKKVLLFYEKMTTNFLKI